MGNKLCNAAFYKAACDRAIASLQLLKSNPKTLTPEEREILLGFPGGGILKEAGIFNGDTRQWVVAKREVLRSLLTPQEWESLENSGSLNAHYTKPEIVAEMWRFLKTYLQPGARVIDPGCGTGRFYLGCPEDVNYVGIDNDLISAAISKLAHPKADIVCKDFLLWKTPDVDGVIGNIPFVNGTKTYYLNNQKLSLGLHAQFFIKSLNTMKEGAVLALLTSINTLDSLGQDYVEFRKWVDKTAHFLGAIRLPVGAVHDGGTAVTTDLILLKKRKFGDKTPNPDWIKAIGSGMTEGFEDTPEEIQINEWFVNNPQFVLGELGFDALTQGKRCAVHLREGQDVVADLRKALDKIGGKEEMGYTHYWWQPRILNSKEFELFMESVKQLRYASTIPLYFEESSDNPSEKFVILNGLDDDEYEDAVFAELQDDPEDWDEEKGLFWTFCKTNQKKYDQVVFASMLAFVHHFPHDVKIASDGDLASGDFDEGVALFEKVFGVKVAIEQPNPESCLEPLIIKFENNNKETEIMPNNATTTTANWEAFGVKFVDKKGKEAGDAAVQIWFPEKPPEKVTDTLGKVGFRFHGNGVKYWYCYLPGEVPQAMQDKGIKTVEAYVRGLVKSYSPKGAHISQEKPKPEAPATPQAPAMGGGMLKMLREMADELKALRSEVAEIKERSGNSAELMELKAENAKLKEEVDRVRAIVKEGARKYDDLMQYKTKLAEELAEKTKIVESQSLTLETSVKHIADLEAALAEKERIIADKQQTIAVAASEIDRLDSQYQGLVKSINDQGFTVEEFIGGIPEPQAEEVAAISFDDDDTPAISFDSDESAEPLADDVGDDSDGGDLDSSGTPTDSPDSTGVDEDGFDLDLLDDDLGE